MRLILLILITSVLVKASTISLDEILQKLRYEHPVSKSIKAYEALYKADNKAKSSREALQLITDGSYAKPDLDKFGYEYSIGVEQKFMNSSVKESLSKSARYQSDAEILNLKHDFLLLENDVRLLYHLNCLDKQAIEQYKASYLSFKTLYTKKEKAYKYGEISKKELLQLQIELDRLNSEYKHIENEEKTSRNNLQSKILLPIFEESVLSCKDTYAVTEKLVINNNEISLQVKSLNKKIKSAQSDFNQYDSIFDSYTLFAAYQDEIDTKRFVVGLSIPLNFTSPINEEKRAAAMHKKSALEYEKQGLRLERESKMKLLEKRLLQSYQNIESVKSMLNKYENELMPLIERGYRLGEDSAIEYLLSQREMWMYKKDLIQHHKNYYEMLFKLYSILEIKD
ncbi:TolC family protein [Sulfurimonas sp.]|uniref:TolC family protein n=1 Tax=Sulfurimonas sp. TaxID=2022749 RepID=UPI00262DAB70|nr:TolC family protein [Sulfurimonas sp.]MCW8895179.1 TolC family protein [Sulfurimonas sp.]